MSGRSQDSGCPWKRAQRGTGNVLFCDRGTCCVDAFTLWEVTVEYIQSSSLSADSLFANSPTHWDLFVTLKSVRATLWSFIVMGTAWGDLSQRRLMVPADCKRGAALPDCFSSRVANTCSFCSLPSATFFAILCFLLVISLFKIATKHNAEVVPSIRL